MSIRELREAVEAHRENARVLGLLHNELQGRIDAPKLAALFECLARSTAVIASKRDVE